MTSNRVLQKLFFIALLILLFNTQGKSGNVIVNGNITSNTTWTSDNIYTLTGFVYVNNNATLTIEAGTIIKGDSETLGSLIITRGSKLIAIGTPSQPIVFTSAKEAGQRSRGDWGGVILLGYAPVNWPGDTGHVEGITPNPNTLYGGGTTPNAHDNSGTLQYVRIEFAGIALAPNNEINGLTFGGVGDGTVIDHVQVSYSNDDSYEWFGGTVNCKYLVAYDGIDDDFDTDNGFSGKCQFLLGMRDPNVADVSGSKTFESDNDPTGSTNLPQTSAVFANVTGLGGAAITSSPNFKESAHIRRNSNEKIYNSIMMGFPLGILIDGSSTIANCATTSLVKNCFVEEDTAAYISFTPAGDASIPAATTNLNGYGNVYSNMYNGVLGNPDFPLTDVHNLSPVAGNPLPSADNSVYNGDAFFTNVDYIGAFNPDGDTWADGWTNFDPENATYTGIHNLASSVPSLSLFPNPVKEMLQLNVQMQQATKATLQITDLSGHIFSAQENSFASGMNHVSINIASLPAGMYTLQVMEQNQMQSVQVFVKQ